MKNFKVEEVSIPKIKNGYLTDYLDFRFTNSNEFWSVSCFPYWGKISILDKIDILVKSMTDCNPMSLNKEGWNYQEGYLCVSSHEDTDGYILYEFYREGSGDKPYSTIWGRTKEVFDIGDSYVFCYKKVE